jgi:hypothetical protein
LALDFANVEFINPSRQVPPDSVETKTSFCHFFKGFFFGPSLNHNGMDRAHCPGSIRPELTVNKNGHSSGIAHDLEKTDDLLFFGVPCFHVNMFVFEPRICELGFIGMKRAKADNGFDPPFFLDFSILPVRIGRFGISLPTPCADY